MSAEKRYYWLKLQSDFFSSMRIKKLRKLAGGDTLTIIYLKLQLKAIKSDGVLEWTGLESNIFDELALDIDEDRDNVELCLRYLLSCGLAETSDNAQRVFLPWVVANTGSESSSAERVRRFREGQKALQCNADVTPMLRSSNTEIEKEKDIKIELEQDRKKDDSGLSAEIAEVMSFYLDNIEAEPYFSHIDFIKASINSKGAKAVLEALKKCKASGKTSFTHVMREVNNAA